VTLILKAMDGSLVGFAALNFGSTSSALHLPVDVAGCSLQEVLAGPPCDAAYWEPRLGERCSGAEAMAQNVPPRDARFFLLQAAEGAVLPAADLAELPGPSLEIFFRSPWRAPRAHLAFGGAWTPAPGWPMRRFDLPEPAAVGLAGGAQTPMSPGGSRWWTVHVPLSSKTGPVEVVFSNGGEKWDRPEPSGSYFVEGPGAFIVQGGVVEKVELATYTAE